MQEFTSPCPSPFRNSVVQAAYYTYCNTTKLHSKHNTQNYGVRKGAIIWPYGIENPFEFWFALGRCAITSPWLQTC